MPPKEGWYPDPRDSGQLRFWGSAGWSSKVKKLSTSHVSSAQANPAAPARASESRLRALKMAVGVTEEPEFVLWGRVGALMALNDNCVVFRGKTDAKGNLKGDWLNDAKALSLFYSDINAIEVRNLGKQVYLTILTSSFSGAFDPVKVDMDRGANLFLSFWDPGKAKIWNSTDEPPDNILSMSLSQFEQQKKLVERLKRKVASAKNGSGNQILAVDLAGQLSQLADMRGSGALSEEEYSMAKKKLLG